MMEPHASIAAWKGDKLTLWTSNQMIDWNVTRPGRHPGHSQGERPGHLALYRRRFRRQALPASRCLAGRTRRPGGRAAGEGGADAADDVQQHHAPARHDPAHPHRCRRPTASITAIGHESWSGDLPDGKPDGAVHQTRLLYAGANRMTATRLAVLDLPEGNSMRAPGEATGPHGARDRDGRDGREARHRSRSTSACGTTPRSIPRSPTVLSRSARSCPACASAPSVSAGMPGNAKPASTRDGDWLIGMGVAAAIRGNQVTKSGARVRLDGDGVVTVETDMTDIGTGSYTIIAQTAAEMMGVPLDKVVVQPGRLRLSRLVRLRRSMGRQLLDSGRLCGLHEAARSSGAEARHRCSPMPTFENGEVRSGAAACRSRRGQGRARRRGLHRVRRPRQEVPGIDLRGALRRGRRRQLPPARSASVACSRSAPRAASSTR